MYTIGGDRMKVKGLIIGLGMLTGLATITPATSQAFVAEEEWTDYDPCGWNVEQEAVPQELTLAEIAEDKWTDYDPCGWNAEQETAPQELTLAEIAEDKWTDYDPCGWNVEQETVDTGIATTFPAGPNGKNYMN
jgi:hypothetical protein